MITCESLSSVDVSKKKMRNGSRKISLKNYDKNNENFSLIWLDGRKDQNEIRRQLRSVINYIKQFQNVEQCIKYVLSIKTEKVFLIVSETLSEKVIPRVHDHRQLEFIYIYSHQNSDDKSTVSDYAKVSGIFSDNSSLISKVKEDYQLSSNNLWSTSILQNLSSINKLECDNSISNSFPLLIELIIRTTQSDTTRRSLLNECELEYIDNDFQQKSIDDFRENYKSANSLSWLKRDCFISRLLNKAFLSQDIVVLFKFRFFLIDLNQQLEKLHLDYLERLSFNQQQFIFYHGQFINNEELEKIKTNIGQFISINNYFLTTTNREIAIRNAKSIGQNQFVESIVVRIVVDRSIAKHLRPFAKINDENDDHQILFSPGTIFQNESTEQIGPIWFITLKAINQKQIVYEHNCTSKLTVAAHFLWKIGKYDQAQQIFELLFDELRSLDHHQCSTVYYDVGHLHSDRGHFNEALDYYEKSLKHEKKWRLSSSALIGKILNNIGYIYSNRKQHQTALKYYKESLQIRNEISSSKQTDLIDIATTYSNIGNVFAEMNLFSRALINLEKALNIQLKQLPTDHPDIANSYNSIGYVYFLQGYFNKALKTYQKALEMNLNSIPNNHINLFKIYSNIALVHFGEQKYLLAIEFYEKAIGIGELSLSRDHPIFVQTYDKLASIYKSIKNYSMAIKYFRKSLEIERKRSKPNCSLLLEISIHIATCYEIIGKYSVALDCYKEALKYSFRSKIPNYYRINYVQNAIRRCINKIENRKNDSNKKKN